MALASLAVFPLSKLALWLKVTFSKACETQQSLQPTAYIGNQGATAQKAKWSLS